MSNHLRPDPATFDILETLPASLRQEICFAARVWDAVIVRDIYKREIRKRGYADTVGWLSASIRAEDETDIVHFGERYRRRYGQPLPHLGAGASVLRYLPPARPKRHAMRCASAQARAALAASGRLLPR